jgi:hypothetical protein
MRRSCPTQHARRIHRYTYADYVALEQTSSTKHEFLDGEIYALAGGTEEHFALAAEYCGFSGNAVVAKPCRVHTSEIRIYVEPAGQRLVGGIRSGRQGGVLPCDPFVACIYHVLHVGSGALRFTIKPHLANGRCA